MTWAFVPAMPKELTPARSGPGTSGHGPSSRRICTGIVPQAIAGFGSSKWSDGGSRRWRRLSATLISPATPAAPSVWPMFVLTEPTTQG